MDRKYRTQEETICQRPRGKGGIKPGMSYMTKNSLFHTPTCPLPSSSSSILLYMHIIEETATDVGQWKSHTKTSLLLAIRIAEYRI